jgi:hypothetical protein
VDEPLLAVTEARINRLYFRSLRLAGLRWLAASSLPLWAHAYGTPLHGSVVWLAVLATGSCFALAAVFGATERRWRLRIPPVARAAPVVIAVPWPDLDRLRSALLWSAAALAVVPWCAALGVRLPVVLEGVGSLAAVVVSPTVALEVFAAAREMLAARRGRPVKRS